MIASNGIAGNAERQRGSDVATVVVAEELGAPPNILLERALEQSGFWSRLENALRARSCSAEQFRIIIKPDLDFYTTDPPGGTDPALVEHLIELLHDRGYAEVTVGDGRNEDDAWLHNREALVVPDLAGYRFATPKGRAYSVVDLSSSPVRDGGSTPVSRHWADAAYRINFAKNRTHEAFGYALCVHNLAGVVARVDASGALRTRLVADDCLDVLRSAPPHFNLIDAYTSLHGGAGQRAPRPAETHAFIASGEALLADWAGAVKMGLDPYGSPVNATALRALGLPRGFVIRGDVTPYAQWRNVHPLLADSARRRQSSEDLGSMAGAWFQTVDRGLFQHKDFFGERINSFVAPLMADIDRNPRSLWSVVLLNRAIASVDKAIECQRVMFAKDRLRRRVAPPRLDPAALDATQFDGIPEHVEPFRQMLSGAPPTRTGARWRYVDDSVVFECSHVFPIAFDRFVAAVDIARSIQYMNDYIGGSAVAVRRDRRGRVVHQVERNLYLQQPNWTVLFGGDLIDVEKIELIGYGDDRQTITWRTLSSPNGSARFDDGIVDFEADGPGRTKVTIFARQQFAVPPLFRILDIGLFPELRDPLVDGAYATFFAGTIANLQAACDGREYRIGRDADAKDGDPVKLARFLATGAAAVAELLRHRHDVTQLGQFLAAPGPAAPPPSAGLLPDRDGFRHFGPQSRGTTYLGMRADAQAAVAALAALARDAPGLAAGLAEAVGRDLDDMARAGQEAAR